MKAARAWRVGYGLVTAGFIHGAAAKRKPPA
jgi:hypothetical protein